MLTMSFGCKGFSLNDDLVGCIGGDILHMNDEVFPELSVRLAPARKTPENNHPAND